MSNPRSLDRQVVLEEDEYTQALERVIQRDFFPLLEATTASNEYLDASATGDPALIAASVRKLQGLDTPRRPYQTPSQTPYGAGFAETPRSVRGEEEGERPAKRPRYDEDLSLDAFQARYTSEDNSSFTQILHEENRQRKEKWTWAWEAQQRVEAQRDRMIEAREKMMTEGPSNVPGVREKLVIEAPISLKMIMDNAQETEDEEGKQIATVEDSERDVMAPIKDKRTTVVDGWKFKARNTLMFPPDADIAPYATSSYQGESYLVETRGEPKSITHSGTRLPEKDEPNQRTGRSEPPSPTPSRVQAAISGTKYVPTEPFPLVPAMPSPTPDELGPAAVKQLMTWGTLSSTPRVISTSGDPADIINSHIAVNINNSKLAESSRSAFHLPVPSSREVISRKLSNNASKSLRTKAGMLGLGLTPGSSSSRTPGDSTPSGRTAMGRMTARGSMAPPSWTTPRTPRAEAAGSLTPAGKRLLDRSTIGTLRANARGHGPLTPNAAAERAEAVKHQAGWESGGREKELSNIRWEPNSTRRRDTDEFEAFTGLNL